MSILEPLIGISRRYGGDPEFVLVGGGNTSLKHEGRLYVKASGQSLAVIEEAGFVSLDLGMLEAIWEKDYPEEPDAREKAVLADLLATRLEGESSRPSVEALLHALLPQAMIVHLHPALINGLACSADGERMAATLFDDRLLWVPSVNPGYILARTVRDRLRNYRDQYRREPLAILLQNHGVFAGGDSPDAVDRIYEEIMERLRQRLQRIPDLAAFPVDPDRRAAVAAGMEGVSGIRQGSESLALMNRELSIRLADKEAFSPISSAFTPDHIVYSGFKPLWVPETVFGPTMEAAVEAIANLAGEFSSRHGAVPKTIAVQNTGVFSFSAAALALFLDTLKVAAYAESFGGPKFMSHEQIDFIRNWEVEAYRAKVAGA